MANITLPYNYTTNDVQKEVWTYTFGSGSLTRTNTAGVVSDISVTINSFDGTTVNFTISVITTITRSGTDPGTFAYISYPSLKITAGGVDETFYSTSGLAFVGGNQTQFITFSSTFDHVMPPSFVNKEWTITNFIQVNEDNTGRTDTGTATSVGFTIPIEIVVDAMNSIFFGTNF